MYLMSVYDSYLSAELPLQMSHLSSHAHAKLGPYLAIRDLLTTFVFSNKFKHMTSQVFFVSLNN